VDNKYFVIKSSQGTQLYFTKILNPSSDASWYSWNRKCWLLWRNRTNDLMAAINSLKRLNCYKE
jgi:hypothetical protein